MAPTIVDLDSLDEEGLRRVLGHGPYAVLAGSAVSIWSPTNVPAGQAIADSTFDYLFADLENTPDRLGELYKALPFEVVMEAAPDTTRLRRHFRDYFANREPNAIHQVIASAVAGGEISALLTTNYDCCFEECLPAGGPAAVIREQDWIAAKRDDRGPILAKLHGSVSDSRGETLVFQLSEESVLPPWKRDLLRRCVKSVPLIVVGYSGVDFEITPEIDAAFPARIIWNFRSRDSITETAVAIMHRRDDVIVVGDMRKFVSRVWGNERIDVDLPSNEEAAQARLGLFPSHSDGERDLWRLRLLNTLSFPRLALSECDRMADAAPPLELARALFHSGRYRQAALLYEGEARKAKARGEHAWHAAALLEASDAWRSNGNLVRTVWTLAESLRAARAAGTEGRSLRTRWFLKALLVLNLPYRLMKKLRLLPLMFLFRRLVTGIISSSLRNARELGDWFDAQQLVLWGERFDLAPDTWAISEHFEMPAAYSGYRHLGFIAAESMALRDELHRKPCDPELLGEAKRLVELQSEMGLNAEVWKLAALLKRIDSSQGERERIAALGRESRRRCEYSWLARLGYTLRV